MRSFNTRDLALMGLFAALLCICSWISIPAAVPFTLQTFGVFITLLVLGGKRGTVSIIVYLALGAAGLPVFSGFRGGVSALLGPTGGYLTGFVLTGLCYLALERAAAASPVRQAAVLAGGLLLCYAAGTAWFVHSYTAGPMTVGKALSLCVWPFLIPDAVKLALAALLARRLQPALRK